MSRIEHYASRLAPNVAPINAIFIARHFNRVFGRRPRPPQDPEADYHDFLVDRMSCGGWSSTQLRCVDKVRIPIDVAQDSEMISPTIPI